MNASDLHERLRGAVTDSTVGSFVKDGVEVSREPLFEKASEVGRALRPHLREPLVYLSLPNSLLFPVGLLALWGANRATGLLSPKYATGELTAINDAAHITEVLTCVSLVRTVADTLDLRPVTEIKLPFGGDSLVLLSKETARESSSVDEGDALVKFSSGSTGVPKGVLLTAGQIAAGMSNVQSALRLTPGDTILAVTPLCHSYAFDIALLAALGSGARLIIQDGFIPRALLTTIERESVTVLLGVPPMYRALLETRISAVPRLVSLRWALSCTAHLAATTISQFHERFGVTLCQHYGSSETGGVTLHDASRVLALPHSVGRPLPNVTVRICDASGISLQAGVEGEIVIDSAAVAKGYFTGGPGQNSPLTQGSFKTGDRGYLDPDGFLTVTGRIDSIMNVGGLKVSPVEVVGVLETHPAVVEAGVTGRLDASGEQWIYAAVVVRAEVTEEELLTHCRKFLAIYKIPRRIERMHSLPKTSSGKVVLK